MSQATISERAVVTTRRLRDWLAEMPGWLSSAVFHLVLIVILGLIQISLLRSEHVSMVATCSERSKHVSMVATFGDSGGAGDFDQCVHAAIAEHLESAGAGIGSGAAGGGEHSQVGGEQS